MLFVCINGIRVRCLRRVIGVSRQDEVTNKEVLDRAGIPSMYTLLRQRRLRWLGHVHRMAAFQKTCCMVNWPKGTDTQFVLDFVTKTSVTRYEGPKMDYTNWKYMTDNRALGNKNCHLALKSGNSPSKKSPKRNAVERKSPRHQMHNQLMILFNCQGCNRHCKSRIAVYIHIRRCCRLDGCHLHSLTRLTDVNVD